jgi:1-deoxy-D-xylulose-5-phosphate synthase
MDPEPTPLEIGRGELLKHGSDIGIVAIGVTVWPALHAAEQLEREGLSAAVVNARFVKPLDAALIGEVARGVRCLMTVEEGTRMGGFGSAVLEMLSDQGIIHLRTKIVGLPDWYIEQGPQDLLRERYGLTAGGIYEQAKMLLAQASAAESEHGLSSPQRKDPLLAVPQGHPRTSEGDEQGS